MGVTSNWGEALPTIALNDLHELPGGHCEGFSSGLTRVATCRNRHALKTYTQRNTDVDCNLVEGEIDMLNAIT